ncbi:MAG: insulinase family protein, partial [Calditrichaeota bacterium]|nr:insulinase family protein [Calditrichota bacterium]
PEATYTSISVYYKKPVEPENSRTSYRQNLVKSLHNSILNNRLNELLQQPEPPFLYAGVGEGRFVRTKSFFSMTAVVKDNELPKGLAALLTEARRIREFGVTPGELDRQKSEMLRGIEQAYRERDKSGSANFAAEYLRNFFEDEPIPGIAYEYELWQQYIPEISLAEVNAVAAELLDTKNRVVLINAPEKDGLNLPDESELQSVFEAVQSSNIEPYADNVSDEPLISTLPAPGDVVQKIHNDSLDVHEWLLSNGMRIFAKTTDFKNDQVLFRAFSPGGLSLYQDSVYIAGETAASVVAMGGIGNFDRIELEKKLAGKNVSVSPGINNMSEGVSGGASPEDLETMFQLIHLYFTAPRMDSTAYLAYQAQIRGFLANRAADPGTAFSDTVQVTMSDYHFRTRPWSDKLLQEMDLQKSYQIFRERFANAGDFTFIFVGNIDLLQLESLAETYLASLPATGDRENWRDE